MRIKKTSLPEEVALQVKLSIKAGDWKPGEKLPSEAELAESFGVNRLTVRMALQKLNTLGLVETRVGEGTYVRDFDLGRYLAEVSDFYLTPEMIRSVEEFRKIIEVESVRLALERATPEELDALGAHCDQYDALVRRAFARPEFDPAEIDEMVQADCEFHHAVVRMSKNPLYVYAYAVARESIIRYLHQIFEHRLAMTANHRDLLLKGTAQHRLIYEALRARDFETCRSAFMIMIDYGSEAWKKSVE